MTGPLSAKKARVTQLLTFSHVCTYIKRN